MDEQDETFHLEAIKIAKTFQSSSTAMYKTWDGGAVLNATLHVCGMKQLVRRAPQVLPWRNVHKKERTVKTFMEMKRTVKQLDSKR